MNTDTHHSPGIQKQDVDEILAKNVEFIVLTQGMQNKLGVPNETIEYIKSKGVKVIVEPTQEAVGSYNELIAQNKRVGGLFHSTC